MSVPIRSFLFVPGDSAKKLDKARGCEADALVLDLEDSVALARKPAARAMVRDYLGGAGVRPGLQLWVRINPLTGAEALRDLAAVVGARPAGIVLPKAEGAADVRQLSHYLAALEAREGLDGPATPIVAIATETAAATFALGDYRGPGLERLYGLTWGSEDLSAALGAASNRDAAGQLSLTYQMVRAQMLLGAKAAGVHAFETPSTDYANPEALADTMATARREGFAGSFAIHPAQIAPINRAFSPDPADIARAERIVAAFAAAPDLGTIGIDGMMVDRPHLAQAERILALRDAFAARAL